MGETMLYHPSTVLSMDSSSSESDPNLNPVRSGPPDINIPLSAELTGPHPSWNDGCCGVVLDTESETVVTIPKVTKKCSRRVDTVWGAWFFFSHYFRPVLKDLSRCNMTRDENGWMGFGRSDLKMDSFMVQHDMENIYMWVFKERPENALGKMQLRSFMNGHSRQGERPFPFSADKGFVRSHKMQRKQYRGLSNPQCVHGIKLVECPELSGLSDCDKKRWVELTGRDLNFSIPDEASDFGSWRNLPPVEPELERSGAKKGVIDSCINFPPHVAKKQKKDAYPNGVNDNGFLHISSPTDGPTTDGGSHPTEPLWVGDFTGAMKNVFGPVTAAKTIYEDDQSFLIIVSLPFADLQRVRVTWKNTLGGGVVKIACVSTARPALIIRQGRTFRLADSASEHCPPGEFVRQISLPTRIPDDAKLEAYCDETGTVLEIMVPKQDSVPEEHEVQVCLRPSPSPWV